MTSKVIVKVGLIIFTLKFGAGQSSGKYSMSRDGQKRQIFYDDTQNKQYKQQHNSITDEIPPYKQPQLPPALSEYSLPAAPANSYNSPLESYYQQEPVYTQQQQQYSPPAYQPPAHEPPAPAYAAPAYAPPPAPYSAPPAYSASYGPAPVPYAPPPAPYAPPPASYAVQTYGDTYNPPAQTGYDSYSPGYDGGYDSYGGGYEDSYGKGYKKPHKHKGYHDVVNMKKFYLLKVFGSLIKAKGAVLVGIGKVLKFKGKLLLAKGEALEELGYQLKNIKYKTAPSYGYGYSEGYDDHKGKGMGHKKHKGFKKGKGYGQEQYEEEYDDYKRTGAAVRPPPPPDMSASGSAQFQRAETKADLSSQGPPIPLSAKTQERVTSQPSQVSQENSIPNVVTGKRAEENRLEKAKGETASFERPPQPSTKKPVYSVQVKNKGIKLRTTVRPKLATSTLKTETGFQPMFDNDESGEVSTQSNHPVRNGWSPVKFY